ncbi:MAG: hypothetical protein GC190_18420 [Alphaproteobacteria bacterium]|nr:hypothetical protein [Alphaproteobacteria bacterium]
MAGRMDERGHAERARQQPFAARDYAQEPARRLSDRNPRRDERDLAQDNARAEMPDTRHVSALNDAFVTAFERGAAAMGENLRMYQDETVRFVTERLEHDTQAFEELGKSRSIFDLLAVQHRWLNATTRAYTDEWVRLSRMTSGATERAVGHARAAMSETRRTLADD